jgi:hypothetical protein
LVLSSAKSASLTVSCSINSPAVVSLVKSIDCVRYSYPLS